MNLIKNLLIVTLGFAALILILLWLVGLFNERVEPGLLAEPPASLENVRFVPAAYQAIEQTAEAVGSIQSRSTTIIASKMMATIKSIAFRPGDTVQKGDLLITLDDRDLSARLEQARKAFEGARAAHDQAKLDKDRYEKLLQDRSVSQTQFDNMASAERIAQAKRQQAEETVNEAQVMLSYSKMYATMSGTIIEKFADPGDMASPGKPILSMYDPTNLRVEVAVREQLTSRLKIGQEVLVTIDAVETQCTGTVEEIVPSANPASRSVVVKVSIPKQEGIFPGMFGRIKIPLDPVRYLVIPKEAVKQVGQLELVKVNDHGKLVTRAVRTGNRWNGEIEILSGLSEGEQVAIETMEG